MSLLPRTSASMLAGRSPAAARRGVTLLEVMIAVGVLAVGLLGLASLLPLAQNDMAVANRADRTASLGRAAYRDILISGNLRPDNWLYPSNNLSGRPVVVATPGSSNGARPFGFNPAIGVSNASPPPFVPLLLDPLFVAANPTSSSAIVGVPYRSANKIAGQISSVQIPRISLRANSPSAPGLRLAGVGTAYTCLSQGLAERMFRGNDDCSFAVLADKSYAPLPTWTTINSALGTTTNNIPYIGQPNWNTYGSLQSNGDYSWAAMIEPDIGGAWGMYANSSSGSGNYNGDVSQLRSFKITIIVFYKRPLFDVSLLSLADPPPERPIGITFTSIMLSNTGNNNYVAPGNSVEALLNVPINDPTAAEAYTRVRPEQWIMIMAPGVQNYQVSNPANTSASMSQTVAYWYRIVSPDTVVQQLTGGGYSRTVRLSGPDWPFGATANGVIFEGAVGAYERTWTVDGNSYWAQ